MSQEEAFTWREGDKGLGRLDPMQPGNHVWIGRGVLFDEDDEENEVGAIGVVTSVTRKGEEDRKGWLIRYSYRDHLGQTQWRASPDSRRTETLLGQWATEARWASGRIGVAGDPPTVWAVLALVAAVSLVPALWSLRLGVNEVKEWRRLLRDGVTTDAVG